MIDAVPAAVGQPWHALEVDQVVAHLDTDVGVGLSEAEARRRLAAVGPNRVGDQRDVSLGRLALHQFKSLVVLLLLAAALIAWSLGERTESMAILAALAVNAAIGFVSEWRARVSLAHLRAMVVPHTLVRREGRVRHVASEVVVPGDLVVLEAGAHVPADARLARGARLRMAEAALTGESAPVDKDVTAVTVDTPLAERATMVYLGSTVVAGSGLAVVTATGLGTELGRIGQLVALGGERATPLERQVETLGRRLLGLVLATCGIVALTGILHGEPLGLMLETAISLAVAAIPEGLPGVTTVALAMGLWRLAHAGALVRRLPAVETLGSTTVICSDKTGTMTENQMTVVRLAVGSRDVHVQGGSRDASGTFSEHGVPVVAAADPHLALLLTAGSLVNDASVVPAPDGLHLTGDPTEAALLVAAMKGGLDPEAVRRQWPRRREVPFDPARRLMATFHDVPGGGHAVFVKGGPAAVVALCRDRQTPTGRAALGPSEAEDILGHNQALAGDGLRVLAVAWRSVDDLDAAGLDGLTFVGLVAFADPVRPGVREAIAACRHAGIRTVMLTGDQQATAEAIGRELGLGADAIRSRMSPDQKLALVEELEARGEVVAMTGDGVNDAPALARADIGIAMGRRGTDVAREAADLVLTDDNFATIIKAVAEGRVIYANLRKIIRFLFSCNVSEILAIFAAILLGFPAPLLPLQILWVNLVTDILPALALVRDPPEPDVLHRPPRDPDEALVTWRFGIRTLAEGAVLAAGVLAAYFWVVGVAGPGPRATTIAFTALVLIHPLQAIRCRSERLPFWRLQPNGLSWLALMALVAVQWLAVAPGPVARLLGTAPLGGDDWLVLVLGVVVPVALLELVKARANGTGTGRA